MGKTKIVRVDAEGNLVEVSSEADTKTVYDVISGKIKKVKPKKKQDPKAGMRRFNRGGKV